MVLKRAEFNLLDKVVLGRLVFNPPFKASSVFHDEARFVHVVNGNSRLYSPKDQLNLSTGDSMIMKCESFVNNWFENEDGTPNEVIIIHFYPEILQYIYDGQIPEIFTKKNSIEANSVEKIQGNIGLESFVSSLRYYFDHASYITEDLLRIKFQELILLLVNSDKSGRIKSILSELFQTKEYEFKEIIHTHLFEDLKIEDLAFFAGLSLSSFKRKFKTVFDTSPNRYIKTKRLERALSLLEKSDLRISDIAYDCGFNDIGYFSKSFHSAYNCSPSEYRKMHVS